MQVGRKGQRASERKAGGGVLPGRPRREKQEAAESSKAGFKERSPSRWSQVSHFAQGVTC